MKKNILIILFSLTTSFCFGQDFWTKIDMPEDVDAVYSMASDYNGWIYLATNKGVYISKDNGETINSTSLHYLVYDIAVNDQNEILAFNDYNLFYSNDSGEAWTEIELPSYLPSPYSFNLSGNRIILGCEGTIYKSEDMGINWIETWSSETSVIPSIVALLERANRDILAGMFTLMLKKENSHKEKVFPEIIRGIYCSKDNGNSWNKWALSDINIESFAENSKKHIFAGCKDIYAHKGLYVSTDDGANWVKLLDDAIFSIVVDYNDVIYVSCEHLYDNLILRSFDDGITWQTLITMPSYQYSDQKLLISDDGYLYGYSPKDIYRSICPILGDICLVSANINPTESGDVLGVGNYIIGETTTLTAIPNTDYEFENWTSANGEILSDSVNLNLQLTGDVVVNANFRKNTNIKEFEGKAFLVYPNPFTDCIYIVTERELLLYDNNNIVVTIHDISGRELYKTIVKENFLNLSHLSSGVYLLTIYCENVERRMKIIKK